MDYKQIHDQLKTLTDKYSLVAGLLEIKEGHTTGLTEENIFQHAGKYLDFVQFLSDFEELEWSSYQDGWYRFSALLSWDPGQRGEYGQWEIGPGYVIEYLETDKIEGDVLRYKSDLPFEHETDF